MRHTEISWTDHTFNAWIGCTQSAEGCKNCYAKAQQRYFKVNWGTALQGGIRRRTSRDYWKHIERWDATCATYDRTEVVFVNSMSDFFEDWPGLIFDQHGQALVKPPNPAEWNPNTYQAVDHRTFMNDPQGWHFVRDTDLRRDMYRQMLKAQHLEFIILTKRPENIVKHWLEAAGDGPTFLPNIRIGYSVATQADVAKIEHLRTAAPFTRCLFISAEPLLEEIHIERHLGGRDGINWVIVGGESGPKHRPVPISAICSVADQCQAAGVPVWVKQDSLWKPEQQGRIPDHYWQMKQHPQPALA